MLVFIKYKLFFNIEENATNLFYHLDMRKGKRISEKMFNVFFYV